MKSIKISLVFMASIFALFPLVASANTVGSISIAPVAGVNNSDGSQAITKTVGSVSSSVGIASNNITSSPDRNPAISGLETIAMSAVWFAQGISDEGIETIQSGPMKGVKVWDMRVSNIVKSKYSGNYDTREVQVADSDVRSLVSGSGSFGYFVGFATNLLRPAVSDVKMRFGDLFVEYGF